MDGERRADVSVVRREAEAMRIDALGVRAASGEETKSQ